MRTDPKRVLVYGWYRQSNLGDDLFAEAFGRLWPEYDFTFTNELTKEAVAASDAVLFGGGSFLDNPIRAESGAIYGIESRPILYVGVGLETEIHREHQELLQRSRLVATRSGAGANKVKDALRVPDLAYALGPRRTGRDAEALGDRRMLFLPNVAVLPTREDPQWKHAAWTYFKSECAQFLDDAILSGWKVSFFPMCRSEKLDDVWAATEILSQMRHRERRLLSEAHVGCAEEAVELFSQQSVVVTQRFHGSILANMAGTPSVTVAHHDKLSAGASVPYYGATKKGLMDSVEVSQRYRSIRPPVPGIADFETLIGAVRKIIGG